MPQKIKKRNGRIIWNYNLVNEEGIILRSANYTGAKDNKNGTNNKK